MNMLHLSPEEWMRPETSDRIAKYLADTYREKRLEACQAASEGSKAAQPAAISSVDGDIHLDLDNLPTDFLPSEQFLKLLKIRNSIRDHLATPPPETDNDYEATYHLIHRSLLACAIKMITALLYYLMLDSQFHPSRNLRMSAIKLLGLGDDPETVARRSENIRETFKAVSMGNRLLRNADTGESAFLCEISILWLVGDIFYDTLGSIFPVCAIGKCHTAFTMMMEQMGTNLTNDPPDNYIRRRKTMQREIENWELHGGSTTAGSAEQAIGCKDEQLAQISARLDEIQAQNAKTAKSIDRFDRRQTTLLKYIKMVIVGFVKLFAPRAKPPTFSEIHRRLLPQDRYDCLININEPHRSQIKAVIDYTIEHPIVFKQQNDDQFSLSKAARTVWNRNHEKWERVKGSFESFEQLKAACYNLRNGKKDPFCYQK